MLKNKLIVFICVLFLQACAQLESRRSQPADTASSGTRGEGVRKDRDDFQVPVIPEVADAKEYKVALVLGPGGYKSFAHLGVLKEFKKANIPIHKVVGVEWGALVGALYAQRGQVHELEWKLYKLERVELGGSGFFSKQSGPYNISDIEGYIDSNIEKINLDETVVPFEFPLLSLRSGSVIWPKGGRLAPLITTAIAAPPIFRANDDQMAALLSVDEAVRRLAEQGFNVIILVDVLGDGALFDKAARKKEDATAALWTEARRELWSLRERVSDVVRVPANGISVDDFDSRKVLVTAGEAAGAKAAKELLSKYGF